eukprot:TRINITY_DN29342_c0_g1_i1.p2 TRINITY_DN29342_c0_g1~~TRINITY_DN29342_c0_g1_i1.p2  ORF type:complete len:383 (+),score=13.76 TRINITY_DN29342_c0_g1_i1:238-1386(+)
MRCSGGFGTCFVASTQIPDPREYTQQELKEMYKMCLVNNEGRLIVHGLVARASVVNSNNRKYPKRILKRELKKFVKKHVSKQTALGEMDHPSYSSPVFRHLNLPNITHQVLDLQWRGECVYGVLEVLDTCSGRFVADLFEQGFPVGVSTRGWASVKKKDKTSVIQSDFDLITLDFVPEPSTYGAYVIPMIEKYDTNKIGSQQHILEVSKLGVGALSFCSLKHMQAHDSALKQSLLWQMDQIRHAANFHVDVGQRVRSISVDISEELLDTDSTTNQVSQSQVVYESISSGSGQSEESSTLGYQIQHVPEKQQLIRTNGTHDPPSLFTQFILKTGKQVKVYYSCYEVDRNFTTLADRGIRIYYEHLKSFNQKVIMQAQKVLRCN